MEDHGENSAQISQFDSIYNFVETIFNNIDKIADWQKQLSEAIVAVNCLNR